MTRRCAKFIATIVVHAFPSRFCGSEERVEERAASFSRGNFLCRFFSRFLRFFFVWRSAERLTWWCSFYRRNRYERTFPDHFILPSFHLRVFFHDQDVDILFPRFLASHGCFEEKRCPIASDVGVHGTKRSGRARNKPIHHAEEPQKQLAKNWIDEIQSVHEEAHFTQRIEEVKRESGTEFLY